MTETRNKTKDMVLCGIFAAIMCVCSVITIPTGVIPVTLGTFGIMLTCSSLGIRRGFVSILVFILIGAIGIPVFSGFREGIGVPAGPTGGYITGYLFMPLLAGISFKKSKHSKLISIGIGTLLNMGAMILCYIFGTLQFVFITKSSFTYALSVCVIPFIVFDAIKAFCTSILSNMIKKFSQV